MGAISSGPPIPIFVLSHARTGSTLLRYVIDTHPEVCCPPEIALGRLCYALRHTLHLTLNGTTEVGGGDHASHVRAAIRSYVDQVMLDYCAAKGKRRWCDKSTNNVEHLTLLAEVFPDAQHVCLHRNAMDVVHSLLEMFRFGFPDRYGQVVARSPENIVDAMIDTWIEATQCLIEFEKARASRCFRVRYEDLVANPASVAAAMFAFLELPFDAEMLDSIFTTPHDAGPGDLKVQFTSNIMRGRIGKGSQVPRRRISDERLARVNALHAVLGYAPVGREGGPAIEGVLRAANNVSRAIDGDRWG